MTGKKLRTLFLRKEGDSNPRNPNGFNGFRDRPIRPLSHLSKSNKPKTYFSETGRVRTANLRLRRPTLYPVEPQSQKTARNTSAVAGRPVSDLAEATGVEPARPVRNRRFSKPLYYRSTTPPIPLAGSEREGFEPPIPKRYNGFQDRRVRPLCHRSIELQYEFNVFVVKMSSSTERFLYLARLPII